MVQTVLLTICQANWGSKCSYLLPSPWLADYLIRTSLCFFSHGFYSETIHHVARNLESKKFLRADGFCFFLLLHVEVG